MGNGEFTKFVNNKLLTEEAKEVSVSLTKNIIDILREYVISEYDVSEDEKAQILNNMKIGLEEHDKGILKNGPRFIATSTYKEGEDDNVPVEIVIEIVTEKIGAKQSEEPAEVPSEPAPEEIEGEEETEEVEESFAKFADKKMEKK